MDDLAAYNLSGGLTLVSQLALIVITMIWLFRIAKNHQTLRRRLTWGPGWAIGGWFLPPLVYVIPFLMLRESWKAAEPEVQPGDDRWKSSSDTPLLWVWGVLYVVVPLAFIVVGLRQQFGAMGNDAEDLADFFDDRLGLLVAQSVVAVLAAVAWGLLVRALTDRHTRLTGEAVTPRSRSDPDRIPDPLTREPVERQKRQGVVVGAGSRSAANCSTRTRTSAGGSRARQRSTSARAVGASSSALAAITARKQCGSG